MLVGLRLSHHLAYAFKCAKGDSEPNTYQLVMRCNPTYELIANIGILDGWGRLQVMQKLEIRD